MGWMTFWKVLPRPIIKGLKRDRIIDVSKALQMLMKEKIRKGVALSMPGCYNLDMSYYCN